MKLSQEYCNSCLNEAYQTYIFSPNGTPQPSCTQDLQTAAQHYDWGPFKTAKSPTSGKTRPHGIKQTMRAEMRRQGVALSISAANTSAGRLTALAALSMSVNDRRSSLSTDFEVTNKFHWAGEFAGTESSNHEAWLCWYMLRTLLENTLDQFWKKTREPAVPRSHLWRLGWATDGEKKKEWETGGREGIWQFCLLGSFYGCKSMIHPHPP